MNERKEEWEQRRMGEGKMEKGGRGRKEERKRKEEGMQRRWEKVG